MFAEIMRAAGFAEVCYLIAVILFAIEFIMRFATARRTDWYYNGLLTIAGLLFIALGLLAQPTVP